MIRFCCFFFCLFVVFLGRSENGNYGRIKKSVESPGETVQRGYGVRQYFGVGTGEEVQSVRFVQGQFVVRPAHIGQSARGPGRAENLPAQIHKAQR